MSAEYPFDEYAANVPIHKTAGDGMSITVDYAGSIAGQTFEAAITSALDGSIVQAITCTVTDEPGGTLILSLTSNQTLPLANKPLRWYYARTVSGMKRTEMAGDCIWDRR
jgi:hypothetical protein